MTHKDRGKNGHEEGRSGGAGCCKNLQRGVAILSMSSLRAVLNLYLLLGKQILSMRIVLA